MQKRIEFFLNPDYDEIKKTGDNIHHFLKSHGISDDIIKAEITLIKEIIANGKQLGKYTAIDNEMTVCLYIENDRIIFEAKRKINDSIHNQLREFDKIIQWIRGYQDPFEAYVLKLKEAYPNKKYNNRNFLDLARIAYDGKAILDFFVSEENVLNVSAVRNID